MTQNIDLKELERKAYLSYHQDGVPDIILGICLVIFGIEMAMDLFVLNLFLPLIIMGTGYYGRKMITIPRLGIARFSESRKKTEKRKTVFMAFFGSMVLGAFLAVYFVSGKSLALFDMLKTYPLLILALLWGVMPVLGALLLGAKRMYAYAVLIFMLFVPGQAVYSYEPGRVILAGAAILFAGIWVLAGFMKRYPHSGGDLS